ncbi:hypothetical protein Tco_0398079 [Tanacetum coccineum]
MNPPLVPAMNLFVDEKWKQAFKETLRKKKRKDGRSGDREKERAIADKELEKFMKAEQEARDEVISGLEKLGFENLDSDSKP